MISVTRCSSRRTELGHSPALLVPGSVLVATDAPLSAQSNGEHLRVIDSAGPRGWLDEVDTARHLGGD